MKEYWIVAWNKLTGDFSTSLGKGMTEEEALQLWEASHEGQLIVHMEEGALPPKTYRSLPGVE